MEIQIDKSEWQKVRLGDVATEYSKRINNPSESEFDRFVGSSNIGQWDFRVKSWEPTDSVTSAMKLFEPNDYLLVRRSLYASDFRERAPRAHFSGVCSGDILTIREKSEYIADGFLISVLNSPALWKFVVANASGSITRRIKWKDLANYEFLLPPKVHQVELAELLWSMDESLQKNMDHKNAIVSSYKTLLNQLMIHGTLSSDGEVVKSKCGLLDSRLKVKQLKDYLSEKPTYGANAASKPFETGSPRYIRITDIDDDGRLIEDELVTIDSDNYDDYILEDNDFLFARTGNTVGKTLLYRTNYGPAVYAGYLIRFRLNQDLLRPKFLFYFTKSLKFDSFKRRMVKIGAQPNINSEEYQSMHFPDFPIEEQDELISRLDSYRQIIEIAESKIRSSKVLKSRLINQVF